MLSNQVSFKKQRCNYPLQLQYLLIIPSVSYYSEMMTSKTQENESNHRRNQHQRELIICIDVIFFQQKHNMYGSITSNIS